MIVIQGIIPYFKDGRGPGGVGRYPYLGNSISEILKNIVLKPELIVDRIVSLKTLEYLILLISPIILWVSPRHLSPLIGAFPALMKNILSDIDAQRDLIHQYSVPIVPFLMVAIIASLSDQTPQYLGHWIIEQWQSFHESSCLLRLRLDQLIILWSILGFICLAKFGYFWSIYLKQTDTWQASKAALSLISSQGNVLTTANFAPHLTHRPKIKFTNIDAPPEDLGQFDYVLLNLSHPGWKSSQEFTMSLVKQLDQSEDFQLIYEQDGVYLFVKPIILQSVPDFSE